MPTKFGIMERFGPRAVDPAIYDEVKNTIFVHGLPPLRHSQLTIHIDDVIDREPLKRLRGVEDFFTFTQYLRKQCIELKQKEMAIDEILWPTGEIAHS